MEKVTHLFRYERDWFSVMNDEGFFDPSTPPKIVLRKYQIIKETPKTFVIRLKNFKTKRCFKDSKNSFAYRTQEKAFENFYHRCRKNLQYCKFNLKVAERFMERADELKNSSDSSEYIKEVINIKFI